VTEKLVEFSGKLDLIAGKMDFIVGKMDFIVGKLDAVLEKLLEVNQAQDARAKKMEEAHLAEAMKFNEMLREFMQGRQPRDY
jgi:hypothetical protein